MDFSLLMNKWIRIVKKYRYAVLILIVGIVLMLLPTSDSPKETTQRSQVEAESEVPLSQQLSLLLSQIEGVGDTQVMLTVRFGTETLYQTDSYGSDSDRRVTTVIVSDSTRCETGLIRQVNPPTYLGAIVICEGANDPSVRLAIVDAVSKITGLGTDRISVVKMK